MVRISAAAHRLRTWKWGRLATTAGEGGSDEVGRNMLFTAAGNLAIPFSAVVTAPILAQVLGVEGRGELAAVTAPLILLTIAGTFGIPEAVNHYVAAARASLRAALVRSTPLILLAGVLCTILTLLLAPFLSGGDEEITALIRITSTAILPSVMVGLLRGAASGLHLWRLVNGERYINASVRIVGIYGFATAGMLDVPIATMVTAAAPIIGGFAYVSLRAHSTSPSPASVPRRTILSYGLRIWVGALSGILLVRLDQVLITPLSGVAELGLYAVAVNVADVILIANSAVRDVTFSSESTKATPRRLYKSARVSLLASLLIGAATALTVPAWLPVIFGADFADAVPVTELLILAAVVGVPGSIAGAGLSARGRPGLRSASLLIACLVNIAAVLLLVPSLGAMGAALATLVGNFLAANLNIYWCWKFFGLNPLAFYALRFQDAKDVGAVVWRLSRRRNR
jgi:O-antigen/teichoic acid export membrane protein